MIKMFTQWKIDRLKIAIAGLTSKLTALENARKSVARTIYDDEIFSTTEKLARYEEELRILMDRGNNNGIKV